MQAHRSRSCEASCVDGLIVGAVVGSQIEPGQCSQGGAAKAMRPGRCGQGDAASSCARESQARQASLGNCVIDISCVYVSYLSAGPALEREKPWSVESHGAKTDVYVRVVRSR